MPTPKSPLIISVICWISPVNRLLEGVLSSANRVYSNLDVAISLAYEEVCQYVVPENIHTPPTEEIGFS